MKSLKVIDYTAFFSWEEHIHLHFENKHQIKNKTMDKISFSLMRLVVESPSVGERYIEPTPETFLSIENDTHWSSSDGSYYDIEVDKNTDYLWMNFSYGKASPRSETITNIITGEQNINPRKENEAELSSQLFILYYFAKHTLYISDGRKKTLLQQFLREKLKINITILSFFKSPDEIIEILDSVKSVKFTNIRNLFSTNSPERQALIDLTGTDAPEEFTIEAKYNTHQIGPFLQRLMEGRRNEHIQSLTICGLDESGLETIYNIETLTQKIEILVNKDERTGMFTPDEIKSNLLQRLL